MVGVGGELVVAMEAARNLNLGDLSFSTQQVDMLDVESMINKLGAGKQ